MKTISSGEIVSLRLARHFPEKRKSRSVAETVARLGAMQAQDITGVQWSIGLRTQRCRDNDVEKVLDDGSVVRTHVLRPTWHLLLPENVRWMQQLTAPRVKKLLSHYDKKFSLDRKILRRSFSLLEKALTGGKALTRDEIGLMLERSGIAAKGVRLGHILMHAELDVLLCNGPRKGKQITYALCEERISSSKKLTGEEALAALAHRYYSGHGPAQVKDFAWWSGLTIRDAQRGTESIAGSLLSLVNNGRTFWMPEDDLIRRKTGRSPSLLSIYDEYTIAYTDRNDICEERYRSHLSKLGNALTAVLLVGGMIAGTWRRRMKKGEVVLVVHPFRKLLKREKEEIAEAAVQYGNFYSLPVTWTIT